MTKKKKMYANMRAAKERKRLEDPAPDYAPILPELRRKIEITDYDCGKEKHVIELFKTNRIDCFRVYVDGELWKKKIGFSNILAGIRKSMPRVLSERNI